MSERSLDIISTLILSSAMAVGLGFLFLFGEAFSWLA